jgi:hypothetical protein
MSAKKNEPQGAAGVGNTFPKGVAWFDEATHTSLIADYAQRFEPFLANVADGVVTQSQLNAQEARLVGLMQEIEPLLEPKLHAKVTELLCELTAYDIMHAMHMLHQARPNSAFRG